MIKPGTSRRMSAGRPSGRSSKSLPGISCSEEDETIGGAVTRTGGRAVGGWGVASCATATALHQISAAASEPPSARTGTALAAAGAEVGVVAGGAGLGVVGVGEHGDAGELWGLRLARQLLLYDEAGHSPLRALAPV